MTDTDIAKQYGEALYRLAEEEDIVAVLLDEIRTLRKILRDNPDFLRLIDAPNINLEDRKESIDAVFKGKIHEYLLNFLKLMSEHRYCDYLYDCFKEFERLYDEDNAILVAHVTSAVALSEEQKESLRNRIYQKANKTVVMKYHVEPELIGGIRVNMDGVLYEGTIKSRLDELKGNLKKETL